MPTASTELASEQKPSELAEPAAVAFVQHSLVAELTLAVAFEQNQTGSGSGSGFVAVAGAGAFAVEQVGASAVQAAEAYCLAEPWRLAAHSWQAETLGLSAFEQESFGVGWPAFAPASVAAQFVASAVERAEASQRQSSAEELEKSLALVAGQAETSEVLVLGSASVVPFVQTALVFLQLACWPSHPWMRRLRNLQNS